MRERPTIVLLLVLLAVMTCLPLVHSGYTTTDDIYGALGVQEGWRSPGFYDARMSGRFQHAVSGLLIPLAYGYGHYWLTKALALAAILSNVAALFVVLRVLTGDTRLGILAAAFFFAIAQNTQDHNLLTAYPVILCVSLTCFLLSVAAWWTTLQDGRRLGALSVLLFGLSLLTYETFMAYGVVFPALTFAAASGTLSNRLRRAVRTPHLPWLVIFAAVVVGFRLFFQFPAGQQAMSGEQYTINFDLPAIGKVIERYSVAALPLSYAAIYRGLVNDVYLGFGTFRVTLFEMFEVIDAAWMVKATIVGFLTATLTLRRDALVKHRGLLWFLVFVFMVLSHLPTAVASKYQTLVIAHNSHGAITSYFALFGVVILLALVVDGLVGLASKGSRTLAQVVVGVAAVAAFLVSYGTDFLNAHVAFTQRQMYDKWQIADAWIGSPFFQALPEGSLVLAPTLFDHYPGSTFIYDEYWTRYALNHGRKRVEIIRQPAEWYKRGLAPQVSSKLYYLKVMQEPRGDAAYLIFARVEPPGSGAPLASSELHVLLHARSEHIRVFGQLLGVDERCRARVMVDGVPSNGTFRDNFGAHIDRVRDPEEWRWATLTSRHGFLAPESLTVSSLSEPVDGPVDVVFDDGFYLDEVTHRWAAQASALVLRNRADRDVRAELSFEVRAPALDGSNARRRLDATAGDARQTWSVGAQYEKHSLQVDIPARSSTSVRFSTDAPAVVAPLDGRTMVLMFRPTVRAQEADCDGAD